tara:strand:+ start:96 stop:494 length:399 start_codon:yes stop_codon:yes gene_type:complete
MERIVLKDAYDAITELNLWNWVNEGKEKKVRAYEKCECNKKCDCLKKLERLENLADKSCLHSGSSYNWTMAVMNNISKTGYYNWKWRYIKNNYKREYRKAHYLCFKLAQYYTDPSYLMCRKRLHRDYYKLFD